MRKKMYLLFLLSVSALFSGCGSVASDSVSQENEIETIAVQQESLDSQKRETAVKIDLDEINRVQEQLAEDEGQQ